jgi:hypothetical protein
MIKEKVIKYHMVQYPNPWEPFVVHPTRCYSCIHNCINSTELCSKYECRDCGFIIPDEKMDIIIFPLQVIAKSTKSLENKP